MRWGSAFMKSGKFILLTLMLIFSLPYLYGGCVVIFSSGDTSRDKNQIVDNSVDDSSAGFIGVASQAVINAANAENLAGGALAGGLTGAAVSKPGLDRNSSDTHMDAFRPLRFPLVLEASLRKIESAPTSSIFSPAAIIIKRDSFSGGCGGNFSYTLNFNKTSQQFQGHLSFTDYCDQGIIISGQTDVNGTFDAPSGDLKTANFSFDDLSDKSITLNGDISISLSDPPIIATFSACAHDKSSGLTYWLKDYSMNIDKSAGYVAIEIFGRFYHPDHGFVKITTTEPFIIHDEDDWPTSGRIEIRGADNTNAQLTTLDYLYFGVEADTDGNGIFDWDSGTLNWHDL
jgi:hypothetical protein